MGHMFTKQGIKANPKKIQTIQTMTSPSSLTEVQSLNGKPATLSRFVSRAADKPIPFFRTLKGCLDKKSFKWTSEAEEAFQKIKDIVAELPMLIAPESGETLTMYLAATPEAVSAVLLAERGKIQMPIYFVSKVLQGAEANYPIMEKLVLALIHAARRLRRYFQAHPIVVITDQPIKNILAKPEH